MICDGSIIRKYIYIVKSFSNFSCFSPSSQHQWLSFSDPPQHPSACILSWKSDRLRLPRWSTPSLAASAFLNCLASRSLTFFPLNWFQMSLFYGLFYFSPHLVCFSPLHQALSHLKTFLNAKLVNFFCSLQLYWEQEISSKEGSPMNLHTSRCLLQLKHSACNNPWVLGLLSLGY